MNLLIAIIAHHIRTALRLNWTICLSLFQWWATNEKWITFPSNLCSWYFWWSGSWNLVLVRCSHTSGSCTFGTTSDIIDQIINVFIVSFWNSFLVFCCNRWIAVCCCCWRKPFIFIVPTRRVYWNWLLLSTLLDWWWLERSPCFLNRLCFPYCLWFRAVLAWYAFSPFICWGGCGTLLLLSTFILKFFE